MMSKPRHNRQVLSGFKKYSRRGSLSYGEIVPIPITTCRGYKLGKSINFWSSYDVIYDMITLQLDEK